MGFFREFISAASWVEGLPLGLFRCFNYSNIVKCCYWRRLSEDCINWSNCHTFPDFVSCCSMWLLSEAGPQHELLLFVGNIFPLTGSDCLHAVFWPLRDSPLWEGVVCLCYMFIVRLSCLLQSKTFCSYVKWCVCGDWGTVGSGMRAPVTVEGRKNRMPCCLGEHCSLEHCYWKHFQLESAAPFLKVSKYPV